jgi:hypothetical protein
MLGFSKRAARKIRAATTRTLNTPQNAVGDAVARYPQNPARAWIHLTAEGEGAQAGLYSWKLIYPDPLSPNGFQDWAPAITGTLTAREANERSGLANTQPARYLATLGGYNAAGKAVFYFHAGALPTGQYQYMDYDMEAMIEAGWGFDKGHPRIEEEGH